MINQRLVAAFFFFVFFIQAELLALLQNIDCDNNNGNYTSNSAYSANLNATLSSLSTNIGSDGFYNASAGQGTDRVNAIAMCRGDIPLKACRDCVQKGGAELLKSCPNQMQAIIWDDSCTLRYSNASIYGVLSKTRTYDVYEVTSPDLPPPQPQPQLLSLSPTLPPQPDHGVTSPDPAPPPQPEPTSPDPPMPVQDGGRKKSSNTTRIIIIIVAAVVGCLILAASAIIFHIKRKKHKPTEIPLSVDEISTTESLQHPFSIIKAATNDFSDHNKLGEGGFGIVYKGNLSDGREIAVKRLSTDSGQGDLEFKNEVLLLAKLQHRNLVRLIGFAIQGMEKLLIYEFVQNASLDHFIFAPANRSNLDWVRRYKIIKGIARGILYLHEDSRLRIIHRDLKASNILLDGEMNPKIADFGMARLFRQDETHANTSRVVGTFGYMPPEYLMHGQFSMKSDVFSFGVLVLEIISGQSNNAFRSRERVEDLVIFAWRSLKQGRSADVVDPFLRSGSGSMNEMLRCIHIGLLCVQEEAAHRPTMASVVLMLSSFTMSLALPSAPAFYASDASFTQQEESYNNSTNSKQEISPGPAHHQSQLQPL